MKGIVLAGGTGTRLWPITEGVSKQLLHVHDKPMIYYPLSTLMLAGIREIAIITTEQDQPSFKRLLGDGSTLGINIEYFIQHAPNGIAEAFILCENFIGSSPVALILGDNIFEDSLAGFVEQASIYPNDAQVMLKEVTDPQRYGVAELKNGVVANIEEKPANPKSNLAVAGIYLYPSDVFEVVRTLKPSGRGELEITDVNNHYLHQGRLRSHTLQGFWTDAGTLPSLHVANELVRQKMPVF